MNEIGEDAELNNPPTSTVTYYDAKSRQSSLSLSGSFASFLSSPMSSRPVEVEVINMDGMLPQEAVLLMSSPMSARAVEVIEDDILPENVQRHSEQEIETNLLNLPLRSTFYSSPQPALCKQELEIESVKTPLNSMQDSPLSCERHHGSTVTSWPSDPSSSQPSSLADSPRVVEEKFIGVEGIEGANNENNVPLLEIVNLREQVANEPLEMLLNSPMISPPLALGTEEVEIGSLEAESNSSLDSSPPPIPCEEAIEIGSFKAKWSSPSNSLANSIQSSVFHDDEIEIGPLKTHSDSSRNSASDSSAPSSYYKEEVEIGSLQSPLNSLASSSERDDDSTFTPWPSTSSNTFTVTSHSASPTNSVSQKGEEEEDVDDDQVRVRGREESFINRRGELETVEIDWELVIDFGSP